MARPIDELLKKEMTRREFLATLGFGVGSMLGLSTVIHMLTGKSLTRHSLTYRNVYNQGRYAGIKKSSMRGYRA
jgi:hypothetical protein